MGCNYLRILISHHHAVGGCLYVGVKEADLGFDGVNPPTLSRNLLKAFVHLFHNRWSVVVRKPNNSSTLVCRMGNFSQGRRTVILYTYNPIYIFFFFLWSKLRWSLGQIIQMFRSDSKFCRCCEKFLIYWDNLRRRMMLTYNFPGKMFPFFYGAGGRSKDEYTMTAIVAEIVALII